MRAGVGLGAWGWKRQKPEGLNIVFFVSLRAFVSNHPLSNS